MAAICFDSQNKAEIEERGVEFHCVEDDNRSTNPFKVLSLKKRLYRIIKKVLSRRCFHVYDETQYIRNGGGEKG